MSTVDTYALAPRFAKYLRVTDVTDALDAVGRADLTLLDSAIRPLWMGMKFWGPAVTMRVIPTNRRMPLLSREEARRSHGIWNEMTGRGLRLQDQIRPGCVVVTSTNGSPECGYWGSNNSMGMQAAAGFWQDARVGLAHACRDAFVGPLLFIQGLAALATGGTSALLVVLASRHLALPPAGFSWLLLAIGAGALVGPFLLPRRFGADPRLVFWPYVWRGLGDILLALLTPFPIALFLLFTYGLGTSTGAVTYSTLLQRRVPDRVRGRVFATLDVVWATGEIASIGLAGLLVDRAGIVAIYLGGGALLMLAGVLGLLLPGTTRPRQHPSHRT